MERIITLTGESKVTAAPDWIALHLTYTAVAPSYEKATGKVAAALAAFVKACQQLGFKKEDFKTKQYTLQSEYESYQENDAWKQRFIGYRCTQEVKLEFAADEQRLLAVLSRISESDPAPQFHITYRVKNEEPLREKLMQQAVENARQRAKILAGAAGVMVGPVVRIAYRWDEQPATIQPMAYAAKELRMASYGGGADSITPEDIEITDTVTVTFAIAGTEEREPTARFL